MLKQAIDLFKRPYPAEFSFASNLKYGLTIGAFVYLFMTSFQPFGLNSLPGSPRKLLYIGYGLVTFLAIVLNSFLLPRLLPGAFREETWNTGKSILFMSWVTLVIGLVSYFVTLAICRSFELPPGWVRLKVVLLGTFFVGIIPITAIILFQSMRQHLSMSAGTVA